MVVVIERCNCLTCCVFPQCCEEALPQTYISGKLFIDSCFVAFRMESPQSISVKTLVQYCIFRQNCTCIMAVQYIYQENNLGSIYDNIATLLLHFFTSLFSM